NVHHRFRWLGLPGEPGWIAAQRAPCRSGEPDRDRVCRATRVRHHDVKEVSMSWNRSSSASAPRQPSSTPGVIAASARVLGRMRLGASATITQGTVVRSLDDSVDLGNHSVVLENSVVIVDPWPDGVEVSQTG